ncbi:MAG: DMT family transporter [Flavobacteriaceae bacterium]
MALLIPGSGIVCYLVPANPLTLPPLYKKAIVFMVWSTLSFSVMTGLVKYLVHFPTFELVFFRSLGTLLITTALLKKQGVSLWGTHRRLLVFRGLSGAISMVLFFGALHFISIGSAVTLRYTAPLLTAIFAVVVYKEKMRALQWLFILISFTGVVLVKGFDPSVSYWGFSMIMLCAIFSASVYLIIGKIGTLEHPLVIVNYFMLTATLVGLLGSFFSWQTPVGIEWVLLAALGIFGFFGQYFMTKAFQIYPSQWVAPFKYVEVFFTLSLGLFVFSETYTLLSFLGTFLIIFGLVLHVIYKQEKCEA